MNKVSNKINYKSIVLAFEFSKAGVCTLQVHNEKTGFKADGGNYDKVSAVFAGFFNYHFKTEKLLKRQSVKGLVGHNREKLISGAGIYSHANILDTLQGFNLDYICDTKDAVIYRLEYNQAFLNLDKKDELFL